MSIRHVLAFMSTSVLLACGANPFGPPPPGTPGSEYMKPPSQEAEDQGPKCDPKGCSNFCLNMRCIYDEIGTDKCMAVCTQRCGDAFFEQADAAVMTCVSNVIDLSCEGQKACCSEQFTNQLCAQ